MGRIDEKGTKENRNSRGCIGFGWNPGVFIVGHSWHNIASVKTPLNFQFETLQRPFK